MEKPDRSRALKCKAYGSGESDEQDAQGLNVVALIQSACSFRAEDYESTNSC
jgi:hypothetical protein